MHASSVRGGKGRLSIWDEESGELHRELEGFENYVGFTSLATFLSPDGQQPRLVAGSYGPLRVYDPEAGSLLHRLEGHTGMITALACIASSFAAPHHPRLVSASDDGNAKVWDGETGEMLGELMGDVSWVLAVAVWREHTGGHDRIATTGGDGRMKVWDGEALTLLHDLDCGSPKDRLLAFKSGEGPARLLVAASEDHEVWDSEGGRLLHDGINQGCPLESLHVFESAQGRHLLAILGKGDQHTRHPGDDKRTFVDLWDLGEAPAWVDHLRPAHHRG
jgi:WD40 repeat protein